MGGELARTSHFATPPFFRPLSENCREEFTLPALSIRLNDLIFALS
jgi:hypothetical protein